MRFGQRTIKLESALRESFRFRISFTRGSASIVFENDVTIGQSSVGSGVIGVFVGSLLDLVDRPPDVIRSALVQVVAAPQIELIGVGVSRVALVKACMLLTGQ